MKDESNPKEEFYPGRALQTLPNESEITISNDVIAAIVKESAEEVEGFSRFTSTLMDGVTKVFKGENYEGIFIYNKLHPSGKNIVEIDIAITLLYGCNIGDTCSFIQKKIAENINKYADINVSKVNVYVASIDSKTKKQKASK